MAETYHGKPCVKCGNTERYRVSRVPTCIARCNERHRADNKRYDATKKGQKRKSRYEGSLKAAITNSLRDHRRNAQERINGRA